MVAHAMKVYLDNVIVSGLVRSDLEPTEQAAVRKLMHQPFRDQIEVVTSRESWREQERTTDSDVRDELRRHRGDIDVVQEDHRLLGFSYLQDQYGGFIANPLVTDVVDEALFSALGGIGLKHGDARHLMNAACNGCHRFVTTDPDFLVKRDELQALCGDLRIVKPSELFNELM